MFCPYCGNTIDKLTRHCPSCGASLEDEKEALEPSPAQSVSVETFTSAGKPQKPAQTATTKTADRQATVASNSQTLDEPKKKMSFPMRLLIIVLSSLIGSAMAQSCARRTIEAEASRVNSSNTSRTSTYTSEADDADAKAEEPEEETEEESEQAAKDDETTTTATEDNGKTTESKSSDDTESDTSTSANGTKDTNQDDIKELDFDEMMLRTKYTEEHEFGELVLHLPLTWIEFTSESSEDSVVYRTISREREMSISVMDNPDCTAEDLVPLLDKLSSNLQTDNNTLEVVEAAHSIDASDRGYQAAQTLTRTTDPEGKYSPTTELVQIVLTPDDHLYIVECDCLTSKEDDNLPELRDILRYLETKQAASD